MLLFEKKDADVVDSCACAGACDRARERSAGTVFAFIIIDVAVVTKAIFFPV